LGYDRAVLWDAKQIAVNVTLDDLGLALGDLSDSSTSPSLVAITPFVSVQ
jgi:hypothetical protein